jgi:hypothetical protein
MDIIQGAQSLDPFPLHSRPTLHGTGYALDAYQLYHSADTYLRPVRSALSSMQARASPAVGPYLDKAAVLAQDSPGLVMVGVLLLLLLVVMQLLNFVRRLVMFWVRLVARLLFWAAIGLLVAVVCQRGVGRSVEDVLGWARELSEVWWREYRRWEGYQNQQQQQQQQMKGNGRAYWSA